MEDQYEIENLIELFSKHAVVAEDTRIKMREAHKERAGDAPFPYDDSFSLPMALMTICKEISVIKKKHTDIPK